MKGNLSKYLIIFVPIIAALALLFPTWNANRLMNEEERLKALGDEQQLEQFMKTDGANLASAKNGRLKLGLDLRGGMYVTLEVDAVKLLEEAADKSARNEDEFQAVLTQTRQESETSSEDVVDIFVRNFNAIAVPKGKSLVYYYSIADMKDISDAKIVDKLKRDVEGAIDQALQVIRKRVDPTGTSEVNIQKQGGRRLLLELPDVKDEKAMRQLLSGTARLEFKLLKTNTELINAFATVDRYLAAKAKGATPANQPKNDSAAKADSTKKTVLAKADSAKVDSTKADTTKKASAASDSLNPYAGLPDAEQARRYKADHQLTTLFATLVNTGAKYEQLTYFDNILNKLPAELEAVFVIKGSERQKFLEIINRPEIRRILPADLDIAVAAQPERAAADQPANDREYFIYSLKREPELTGDVITDAVPTFDNTTNSPMVLMYMNQDGSDRWGKITGANIKKRIAVVLDGEVYSAPTVQNKITGGSSQITGMANIEESKLLATILKAGALKAPVKIIEERVVGPSLGEDSIRNGLGAAVIAFILVILFMIIYYSGAGMVANIAMAINVLINIAVLAGVLKGTLTLPGIAGLILTIGLAVDANIIIFERIREELAHGRTLRAAIDEGFRHALPPIIDSHVTTFITAIILYFLGYGPIQGFALTLIIGIFTTLFTGIIVSRAILELIAFRTPNSTIGFGQQKHA